MAKDWTAMPDAEKLEMFSKILTRAAADSDLRDRCLTCEASAKAAVVELMGDISFTPDFSITFIDAHDSDQKTDKVILRLPKFSGPAENVNIPADESNVLCTYDWWLTK
jgi:hypothetical protein